MQGVADAGDELVAVLLVADGRLVEVGVGGADVDRQAVVDGQGQTDHSIGRVGLWIVESGQEADAFCQEELTGKVAEVAFGDCCADEVFIGGSDQRGDLGQRLEEGLPLVVDVATEIEFLFGVLEDGPADTEAVDLLEVEAVGVVVIEAYSAENKEARGEVLVLLCVGVEDAGLDLRVRGSWSAGWRAG